LRVAEQANEEKIIGKEHLPLDFEQAVWRVYAVPSRHYEQIHFSCGGTAWSELNNSLSTNVSVVNTLVRRSGDNLLLNVTCRLITSSV
jgi:hypothetical protein